MSDEKEDFMGRVRAAIEAGNVSMAESDGVDAFEPMTQELLGLIGHPEALVTDLSSLSDFDRKDEKTYALIEGVYGVDVRAHDNLLDIMREIHRVTPQRGVH